MSRKFLDDNLQVRKSVAPPFATAASDSRFPSGHEYLNESDGTLFVNDGNSTFSIWGNWPANRQELRETFQRAPLLNASIAVGANLDFEILGTNAANAGSTFARGRGVTLTTTTASADQVIVTPHLTSKQSGWTGTKWNTNDRFVFETNIKTGAAITTAIIWAGLKLTNTSVVATDDNQVFLRYEAGVASGVWQIISSNANTDTTTNTTVTVAVSTAYHIKIRLDQNRVPYFHINGVYVGKGAALASNIDLIPYVGVQTSTTAARAITVRGIKLNKDLND